ncbi:zinc-dependent alcohol dehydrogenase [Vreelandella titanicae]|uniref:Alcohol dehydrogenase superfamily, zinc-containing n=1 Tax=Vreelandella titanicae BH1 TaxID=1204738 RepID=L9UA12_9GAMM|nr:zinc-binding alcohol dehydrogenase [Halomonas titanicae]ELY21597.1 Alcohol dehydrogenase superfamily, zinc-containing [Halomonas titanicae BH1]NVE90964.1 zinc-binding alcohol dehydrogenase [Halomonas titanicae]|tara:strand:- start:39 stop:1058 length:1020 start_codon:yes stop_codon:yes gene_type:complete
MSALDDVGKAPNAAKKTWATAFWVTNPAQGEMRREQLSPPAQDEVHIRTLYSGISRGTESLVFNGRVPESEFSRMRAPFQSGEFPAPVKYGYCSVGRVEQGPSVLLDKTVFCLFPHQDHYIVPASAVLEVPTNVPAKRAVLAANMETAINGVWDAEPMLGERITIMGAGVVGALVAYLCAQVPGVTVQLVDINPERRQLAEQLDVTFCTPEQALHDQDCVIHASGQSAGLRQALALAGSEGRIIEMSWFGEGDIAIPLGGAFHSQRLTLKASQVGQLPPKLRPRWDYQRRLQLALSLLVDERLDALISGESDFAQLPTLAPQLFGRGSVELCHRLRYPS